MMLRGNRPWPPLLPPSLELRYSMRMSVELSAVPTCQGRRATPVGSLAHRKVKEVTFLPGDRAFALRKLRKPSLERICNHCLKPLRSTLSSFRLFILCPAWTRQRQQPDLSVRNRPLPLASTRAQTPNRSLVDTALSRRSHLSRYARLDPCTMQAAFRRAPPSRDRQLCILLRLLLQVPLPHQMCRLRYYPLEHWSPLHWQNAAYQLLLRLMNLLTRRETRFYKISNRDPSNISRLCSWRLSSKDKIEERTRTGP
jgi:hypothetical protein